VKAVITALLLALATIPAFAQTDAPANRVHDYNYFDVSYQYLDMDGASDAGHGLGAGAGVQINDWLHFFANGSFATFASDYGDSTILSLSLGVGAHTALTEDLSTYARGGYMTTEFDSELVGNGFADFSASSEGYLIGAGLRSSVLPQLEFLADLSLLSMEDDNQTVLMGGLVYSLTQTLTLSLNVSVADDTLTTGFGTRFYFQ